MQKNYHIWQVLWIIPLHLPEGKNIVSQLCNHDLKHWQVIDIVEFLDKLNDTAFEGIAKQILFEELEKIHSSLIEELLKIEPELILELKEQLRQKNYDSLLFQRIQKKLPRFTRRLIALGKENDM